MLFGGGAFGRSFGFLAGIGRGGALLAIPAFPLLSLAIFALSLWVVHGLAVYGEPESTVGA